MLGIAQQSGSMEVMSTEPPPPLPTEAVHEPPLPAEVLDEPPQLAEGVNDPPLPTEEEEGAVHDAENVDEPFVMDQPSGSANDQVEPMDTTEVRIITLC